MKVTIVGCGDAWGSGGRSHSCFRLDTQRRTYLIDCGAASLVGWHRLGFDIADIDAVFLTHLHGDHFGGIPFLLLESQFEARRKRPLTIVGPTGTRDRIAQLNEALFPGVAARGWRFPWSVDEIEPGFDGERAGLRVTSAPVVHSAGSPCTALRVSDGARTFAYSGDTAWTDDLLPIADGADLFVVECYSWQRQVTSHLSWPELQRNLPRLSARRIALTHLGSETLRHADEIEAAGMTICRDGAIFEL